MKTIPSLFSSIVSAGIPYESSGADLLLPATPEARMLLDNWPLEMRSVVPAERAGRTWLRVPFAFLPYWEERSGLTNRPTP